MGKSSWVNLKTGHGHHHRQSDSLNHILWLAFTGTNVQNGEEVGVKLVGRFILMLTLCMHACMRDERRRCPHAARAVIGIAGKRPPNAEGSHQLPPPVMRPSPCPLHRSLSRRDTRSCSMNPNSTRSCKAEVSATPSVQLLSFTGAKVAPIGFHHARAP